MNALTLAEQKAVQATELPAFPVNIHDIRTNVELLLSTFGKYGFFSEYTDHSFSHVRSMLESVEWIIPPSEQKKLTPADWLFITLGIYFHDLGLLVSRSEFNARLSNSEFKKFLEESAISGTDRDEYRAKIATLPVEDQSKLEYQEFVRFTHGARVRAWIDGTVLDDGDSSADIRNVIGGLIGKLGAPVRTDLAKICHSHTTDDIADTAKYKLSKPYGASPSEAVNLQYVAIILRTVDLLHITSNRAPAALYQLISPTDPVSQLEWQKQAAVMNVRPAVGTDKDGRASTLAESNTVEVHAHYEKADGFFGLTNYLSYARRQLTASYNANKISIDQLPDAPKFPWRYIDDSNVEAQGFLTQVFGFELDQQKILDLLTGHTLYNDTNVVLRELTQNALDAIRLQASMDEQDPSVVGRIDIRWSSQERVLEIVDNGTGMTQEVIEKHLLKVGSSRYQDPKFKEQYPGFSSISRFGIGVLSAFMVADNVEITTCSLLDPDARTVSLRSVHGKYLIKLHDKNSDRTSIGVYPHGTRVRVSIRPTAKINNVLDVARSWLLFPACKVYVTIDNGEPVRVGYDSPKHALEDYLRHGLNYTGSDLEVRQVSADGLDLAFAVTKDRLYKDWSFLQDPDSRRRPRGAELFSPIATCVEGVAVDFNTPGYKLKTIISVANATGKGAPKTNVARSALEDTEEFRSMLDSLYSLYAGHVSDELSRLANSDDYSTSRAVQQAPYIASLIISKSEQLVRPGAMDEQLSKVKMLIVESNSSRRAMSLSELLEINEFWTVASPLIRSAEQFVRESPADISAASVLSCIGHNSFALPPGVTVCDLTYSSYIEKSVRKHFEPVEIIADRESRRLSIRWAKVTNEPRWLFADDVYSQVVRSDRAIWERISSARRERGETVNVAVPLRDVSYKGLEDFGSVAVGRDLYLSPNDPLAVYIAAKSVDVGHEQYRTLWVLMTAVDRIRAQYAYIDPDTLRVNLQRVLSSLGLDPVLEYMDLEAFSQVLGESNGSTFNPYAWQRKLEEGA